MVLESGGLLESALQWEASFLGRVAGCFVKSRRSADTVIMLEGALEKRIKQFKELDEGGNMAKTDTGPYFVPPRMVFSYQPPGRFDAAWQVFCTHMRILLTGAAGVVRTGSGDTAVPPAAVPCLHATGVGWQLRSRTEHRPVQSTGPLCAWWVGRVSQQSPCARPQGGTRWHAHSRSRAPQEPA